MQQRRMMMLLGASIFAATPSFAQVGTTCAAPTYAVADGRISGGVSLGPGTYYFAVPSTVGRSYSFEVFDAVSARSGGGLTLTIAAPGTNCTSTQSFRNTAAVTPAIGVFNARVSWTATSTSSQLKLTVPSGASFVASWVASETSLYGSWTTGGTKASYFALRNTTNAIINASFVTLDGTGAQLGVSASVAIAAGAAYSTSTAALAAPAGQAGTLVAVHDGPPGSFLANGVVLDSASGSYVQVTALEAKREVR